MPSLHNDTEEPGSQDPGYSEVLDRLLDETRERKNYFITGQAGTGKTTLIKTFCEENEDKNIVTLASTGIAAINCRGQTIHSFFKFPIGYLEPNYANSETPSINVIKNLDIMIIDEISTVRSDLFNAIDRSLKLIRSNKLPFGGVQVIVVGDLYQLAPIVGWKENIKRGGTLRRESDVLNELYGGVYFFDCDAFKNGQFDVISLNNIFRQTHGLYREILKSIRKNRISRNVENSLFDLVSDRTAYEASRTHTVLSPTNDRVDRINKKRLDDLPADMETFFAEIKDVFGENLYPVEEELCLKVGAKVMLTRNDSEGRWVNGTTGEVVDFLEEYVIVRSDRHNELLHVEKVTWENSVFELDKEKNKVVMRTIGKFTQFPLKLAYAITIHKSQGLTLDRVYIDFGKGMFAHGQTYVAFSRARTLEGLEISRVPNFRDLQIDKNATKLDKQIEILEEKKGWYSIGRLRRQDGELI